MRNLTIGIPTYRDFEGLWATVQALRLYHDLRDVELLVVDNFGCKLTAKFCDAIGVQYEYLPGPCGTALAKNAVFEHARGDVVLCLDSHVMLEPCALDALRQHFRDNPDCPDLIHGPLARDPLDIYHVEMQDQWRGQMWGTWEPRSLVHKDDMPTEPIEVHLAGMGLFACRREAWLGFNPHFRGFGGEEGYLAEKYRQAEHRVLCVPGVRWTHRFGRTYSAPYPLSVDDKFRNALIGLRELGLDPTACMADFKDALPIESVLRIVDDVDRIFAGQESPRENEVPDTGPMVEALAALSRLGDCEQLILMTRFFGRPTKAG